MKPGEFILTKEEINLNVKGKKIIIRVKNSGDRPIQVGSHYHFAETNSSLLFDRKKALGFRLNVPAGSSVRFEPGQEKDVELTSFLGKKVVFGFNAKVNGKLAK
jgi:urease subunit beta